MEQSKEFTAEAGIKVIYDMIEMTKEKIGRNYFYYLFWGYLIAITCISEYVLIVLNYQHHYMVWPYLMSLGMVVTLVFAFVQKRHSKSTTFIGTAMAYFWTGWLVSYVVLLFFILAGNMYEMILPVSMAFYGLGIFVSGGIVNFRPLLAGAVLAWICSVVAYYSPYCIQLIIMTGLMIITYIIPGHILKNKSKI